MLAMLHPLFIDLLRWQPVLQLAYAVQLSLHDAQPQQQPVVEPSHEFHQGS
jgi:hypothetical protein